MTEQHRILVTGASGFVGTWLMRALHDIPIDASVELVSAGRSQSCDVDFDVIDKSAVTKALRDFRPTAVVHLAGIAAPQKARKEQSHAWNVNFKGTVNLALAVREEVPDCRFIFAGSSESYGRSFANANGAALTEDCALNPMTIYGATKAAADIAVGQMYFDGLRSIRFRSFNHTGPGQSQAYVIPAFASQVARIEAGSARPVIEVGNLEASRDFLDVRDVVQAYALAALGKGRDAEGMAFNLASGKATKIRHILDTLVRMSGCDIKIKVAPDQIRPHDIHATRGDPSAAMHSFGWAPQFELETTLSAVLSYWRDRIIADI